MKLAPFLSWYHGPVLRWCRGAGRTGPAVRGVAIAALSLAISGCGERRAGEPVVAARPKPSARWERLEEARAWPLAFDAVASGHGTGEFLASVRVAPRYRSAY